MATVNVNGHKLDPASQQEGGTHFVADASQSNFIILQSHAVLQAANYNALEALQCHVQGYIHPNTYRCRYEPTDLQPLRSLPFVVYANVYHNDLAQRPSFAASIAARATNAGGSHDSDSNRIKSAVPTSESQLYNVYIALHDDSADSMSEVKQALVNTLRINSSTIIEDGHRLHTTLKAEDIPTVATLDNVKSVEQAPLYHTFNDKAREIMRFPPHAGDLQPAVFSAAGETIAVADTGLDNGKLDGIHPAFAHTQITFLEDYTKDAGSNDDFTDNDGHGTHVCGSIVGDSTSTYDNGVSVLQFQVQGTAPQAQLLVQKVIQTKLAWGYRGVPASEVNPRVAADQARLAKLEQDGVIPAGTALSGSVVLSMSGLLEYAYNHEKKARIHNQSWGSLQIPQHQGPYDSTAFEMDRIITKYPDYLVVVAAGNANGKDRNRRLIYNDFSRDHGNPDMIYQNSSQGPTLELRQKPDIVAPGLSIYSARPRPPAVPEGAEGDTILGVDGQSEDPLWYYSTGTSMATPLVSGCAAVVRAQLKSKVGDKSYSPSAALVKAILLNTATDISTLTQPVNPLFIDYYIPAKPVPDIAQGFGRLHMAKAIENITDEDACGYFETGTGANDIPPLPQHDPSTSSAVGTFSKSIDIRQYSAQKETMIGMQALPVTLHVTLVYSDPPGLDLVNLLNLTVTGTDVNGVDQVKVPLKTLDPSDSTGRTFLHAENNVQKIVWEGVLSKSARIDIKAVRVLGNNAVQHYALAWRAVYGSPPQNRSFFEGVYDVYQMRRAYREWAEHGSMSRHV